MAEEKKSAEFEVLNERTKNIQKTVEQTKTDMDKFVLKVEFLPIKMVVYGIVSVVLSSFLVSIIRSTV